MPFVEVLVAPTALLAPPAGGPEASLIASIAPSKEELRRWYSLLHMGRVLDEKARPIAGSSSIIRICSVPRGILLRRACARTCVAARTRGRKTVIVVPCPGVVSMVMNPPWFWTTP